MNPALKITSLIVAMVLVVSIPSAFATSKTFTTFSCASYPLSSHDSGTCYSQDAADVISQPDVTSNGNENLYMYSAGVSITAPDTATLSGISASLNAGEMYLDNTATYAEANVESWLSDPTSCSPSYLCALGGVYSPQFSTSTTSSGDTMISSQSIPGPNRNYGVSTSGTYYVVEYVETEIQPYNALDTYSQIEDPSSHGISGVSITIGY